MNTLEQRLAVEVMGYTVERVETFSPGNTYKSTVIKDQNGDNMYSFNPTMSIHDAIMLAKQFSIRFGKIVFIKFDGFREDKHVSVIIGNRRTDTNNMTLTISEMIAEELDNIK